MTHWISSAIRDAIEEIATRHSFRTLSVMAVTKNKYRHNMAVVKLWASTENELNDFVSKYKGTASQERYVCFPEEEANVYRTGTGVECSLVVVFDKPNLSKEFKEQDEYTPYHQSNSRPAPQINYEMRRRRRRRRGRMKRRRKPLNNRPLLWIMCLSLALMILVFLLINVGYA